MLGYEDPNDHDELRYNSAMVVLAGKLAAKRVDCATVSGCGKSLWGLPGIGQSVCLRQPGIAAELVYQSARGRTGGALI